MNYNYFIEINSIYFGIILFGTILHTVLTSTLTWVNNNKGDLNKKLKSFYLINPLLKKYFSTHKIKKIEKYKAEVSNFNDFSNEITNTISLPIILFGLIPFALHTIINLFPTLPTTVHYLILYTFIIIFGTITNIPFNYYSIFNIEEKYGFNKMPKKLFITDIFKSTLMHIILSFSVISIVNYVLNKYGPFNITNVFYFVIGTILFGLSMEFLYMTVFIRIFNKLEPLKNRNLSRRIQTLLTKYGYNSKMVYVMDSSKRSTKSNAFIGGIGKSKKIVLFDTLLKNFSNDEIISILGHELAHGKLYHQLIGRIIHYLFLLVTTCVIFKFAYDVNLYHTFGFYWVNNDNIVQYSLIGFILMSKVISSISWIFEPFQSWVSRKCEYAADKYSVIYTKNKKALESALIKLSSENMSDIFPHKWYEFYHYSHPSLINRLKAIKNINLKNKNSR